LAFACGSNLTDEETFALLNLLVDTIEADRYPMSPRIRLLREILAKCGEVGGLPPELARKLRRGPGVIFRPAGMISPPSGCLMQPGADPCLRLILSHLEHTACRLDLRSDAPPGDERAR
jgi:hypothetical protein